MEIITFQHTPVATINPVKSGPAPDFTLKDLHGNPVTLSQLADKTVLVSVVPDINTPVCSTQTRYFNEAAARTPEVKFLTISNNTAEEFKSWCASEGIDMTILPDDGAFDKQYHLRVFDGPLPGRLARAIYVIKKGNIAHCEIVNEISDEPDYHKALTIAKG
ncbi:MAG: redoxin family protein [Cellulomonadaceae bacterium]|jgi:thiol peroxidase|nr:redoxin family protein [Cellulomonadaceae bacterium]